MFGNRRRVQHCNEHVYPPYVHGHNIVVLGGGGGGLRRRSHGFYLQIQTYVGFFSLQN